MHGRHELRELAAAVRLLRPALGVAALPCHRGARASERVVAAARGPPGEDAFAAVALGDTEEDRRAPRRRR